jgi:hypothetical protein
MADVNAIYRSTFTADDFKEEDVEFVIAGWETRKFEKGSKIALSFQGEDRQFIVNLTNSKTISEMYGRDPDKWIGKTITLVAGKTDFAGKLVDCIRVKGAVEEKRPVRKAKPIEEDLDDSVPF